VLKLEKIWKNLEKNNVRLSRINGMEIDSTHSLPSSIRTVKSGEEKAGEEKAGEEKAGEEKAGKEKAGEEKAGKEKAGEEKSQRTSLDERKIFKRIL
jgi:uncharacterized low-complexity protein